MFERLNKYGFCLNKTMKYSILDDIGTHLLDKMVEQVKAGKRFTFVLDNIDWDVKVHEMRSDNQNKSIHAVATTLVFDRIPSYHLPDNEPQQSLDNCDMVKLVSLTDKEVEATRQRYKIFAPRIMCEFFPVFGFLKEIVPAHLPTKYSNYMGTKAVVIPLPVLMKDEKKYAEVVDVLESVLFRKLDITKKFFITAITAAMFYFQHRCSNAC